jgi:hypothetical protein
MLCYPFLKSQRLQMRCSTVCRCSAPTPPINKQPNPLRCEQKSADAEFLSNFKLNESEKDAELHLSASACGEGTLSPSDAGSE